MIPKSFEPPGDSPGFEHNEPVDNPGYRPSAHLRWHWKLDTAYVKTEIVRRFLRLPTAPRILTAVERSHPSIVFLSRLWLGADCRTLCWLLTNATAW